MNSREERKRKRIEQIQRILEADPGMDDEQLISVLIVNFFISRRVALEEINAVRKFLQSTEQEKSQTKTTSKDELKSIN